MSDSNLVDDILPPGRASEWDETVDVVVVGFGGAGAVAATTAAETGATVLAIDRWTGGGATTRSGGVVYAGGGTPQQRAAGFDDDPDAMFRYLHEEVGDAVQDSRLHVFCEGSRDDLAWLEAHGVRFPDGFFGGKAIVPTDDDCGLYFSGNEKHYAPELPAVPRGHRVAGEGMSGYALFTALAGAARRAGVNVRSHCRPQRLLVDEDGRVTGVELLTLSGSRWLRLRHRSFFLAATAAAYALHRVPETLRAAIVRFEQRHGTTTRLRARRGVIVCTGGFSFNAALMASEAPHYAGAMPLGTPGDDGSGIRLGRSIGASTRLTENCGASRFIAPPDAFQTGVLVDSSGHRICDESLYAATLSRHIAAHGGKAWLVVDEPLTARARAGLARAPRLRDRPLREILAGHANHVLFPHLFGNLNLHVNHATAPSLRRLAARIGMSPDALVTTVERYNAAARAGRPDEFGKHRDHVAPIETAPFAAVPCHLDSFLFPAPCITLGGLAVDDAQRVLRPDGTAIDGLFAAGRAAVGIASRSYVSGLSLADCVFSGRNAGAAAAAAIDPEASPVSAAAGAVRSAMSV